MKTNFSQPFETASGSFRAFLKTQDSGKVSHHHHPSFEMNYVIKGEGTRFVGTREDYFEEGDLILLAPGIPHHWANKQKKNAGYSSLVMQWDEGFLGNTWQETPEFQSIGRLLNLSTKGLVFDKSFGKEIKHYQTDLLTLPPFERLILLLRILNEFGKSEDYKMLSEEGFQPKNAIPNSRIEKVLAFVKEKYADKITLKMVSSLVHMSEGAFSRYFSQVCKKPFFTYLNEYRISRSCQLLVETDMRINEIGYACGYDCLQFFYRQFMKYIQCAPQDYRRKFQAEMTTSY